MEITIEFDANKIVGKLSMLAEQQLPIAAATALNQTAFKLREELQEEARLTFKNASPFTINSFLYRKATPDKLQAEVFIRDEAPKGNAPSDYLAPHIYGTQAFRTRFQRGLSNVRDPSRLAGGSSILAPNRIMVPTQSPGGVRFNQSGNMTPGQYEQIFTYLRDTDSTRTAGTGRRKAKKAGFAYFYMNRPMVDERRNLVSHKPGIFMRRGGRLPLMRVMTEINTPTYSPKFKFFETGSRVIASEFPKILQQQKFL